MLGRLGLLDALEMDRVRQITRRPAQRSFWVSNASKDVVLTCPFEPAQVVVDPDAKVLQLLRKSALARF